MKYFQPCTSERPCGKGSHARTVVLSKGLVNVLDHLMRAYEHSKRQPISNRDMILNNVEYATWKHLKYFGLIQELDDSLVKPTLVAYDFYRGIMPIFTTVAVMDDKVLPMIHEAWLTHPKTPRKQFIYEIDGQMWKQRQEFKDEMTTQTSIFSI